MAATSRPMSRLVSHGCELRPIQSLKLTEPAVDDFAESSTKPTTNFGGAMRIIVRCQALLFLGLCLPLAGMAQLKVTSNVIERSWSTMMQADALVLQRFQQKPMMSPRQVIPQELTHAGAWQSQQSSTTLAAVPQQPSRILASPPPVSDFDALLDNTHVIPPDTYGSVGPANVVTMLNSQVRIQGKDGSEVSTVTLASFWSAGAGSSNLSDPHVLFDVQSGRWIASITIDPDTNSARIGVAVSAGNDPTGIWRFVTFASSDTTTFPDYPQLGFNNKWIVVTANIFKTSSHGGAFQGPAFWAIDKAAAMLSSGTVGATRFDPGYDSPNRGFTEQPMICYDQCDTLWFVQSGAYTSSGIQLIRISSLTGTTSSPVWAPNAGGPFSGSGFFPVVNNFKALPNGASQSGSSHTIDNGDTRACGAVFRRGHVWFANSGGLPATGTVNRTAVFWYELNPVSSSPFVQSGVVDPGASSHYYYPSIAVNKLNSACIGFTHSDGTHFAEAVYTVRQVGDAAGTDQGVALLKAGAGVYFKTFGGGRNRWGDFSNTVVDPSDSLTFWTIQEYARTPVGSVTTDGSGRWATHWGKIAVDVPLPIQLQSFTGAILTGGTVRIAWTTASEINCYGFRIERSAHTPDNFLSITNGFVPGHGTTVDAHSYVVTDVPETPGRYYYRLTEIDLNGTLHLFDPVVIDALTATPLASAPLRTSLIQNYPNPFNPTTTITYQLSNAGRASLQVFDMVGRRVATLLEGEENAGKHDIRFDGSSLASGTYFYKLRAGNFVDVKRFVLVK